MKSCVIRGAVFILAGGAAVGCAWFATNAHLTPGAALAGVLAGMVLLALLLRAIDRGEERQHRAQAETYRRWRDWYAGLPKPDAAKYDDWNAGDAARFEADTARYLRERGAEPQTRK